MRTLLLLCALSIGACTSSRPAGAPTPVATSRSSALVLGSLADLPAYLVPAPAGSSPRQRRQWQRAQAANLAHAGVLPAKVKNSSIATAPGAVATTVTKPSGAVNTGTGSAANAPKAGQRGGAGAAGPTAQAEATTKTGLSYWWLLVPVAGLLWWQRKRLIGLLV